MYCSHNNLPTLLHLFIKLKFYLETCLQKVSDLQPLFQKLKLKNSSVGHSQEIPIRALLCSYKCFNQKNH